MRIDHLELTFFKNFNYLEVDFQPGVNLLVGGNGSGKTSLLEAINVAVGGFFGSQEQKMQRVIEFDEIKITKRNGDSFPEREPLTTVAAGFRSIPQKWSRTIKRETKTNDGRFLKPVLEYGKRFFQAFDIENDHTVTPLISYYSTKRLFKDSNKSEKQKYDAAAGRRNGYLQCLKENAIKPVLDEWLGKAVTLRATKQIKDIESKDKIVDNVESAIRITLIQCMDMAEDFPLKIYPNPFFDNELFLEYDQEHDLPLSYYSDGFRNLVYLVFDLVWRASHLNPWMNLDQITAQVTGVVTIDEIDLHLHPKWQAKAIGLIQYLFPNVQFFITTHSPTVVANFEKGTLYVISDNNITKHAPDFFGKEINTVLREVLGAPDRHVPTQTKIDRLFRKIDNEDPQPEINSLLKELTESIGTDDAEIQRAISLIEWNKIKNENSDAIR